MGEQKRMNVQESELPLLGCLTKELRNQLRYVSYMHTLREHPLFRYIEQLSDVTMHRICENALQEKPLAERDPLFFQGEAGQHMDVLARGELFYVQKPPGSSSRYDAESMDSLSISLNSVVDSDVELGITKPLGDPKGMRKVTIKKNTFLG